MMIRPPILNLAAISLLACIQRPIMPSTPTTMQLTTRRQPRDIVSIAARELATAGLEIVTSDATGGIVVAKRQQLAKEWYRTGEIVCEYPVGSLLAASRDVTLTISVSAQPGDSSTVQITNSVRSADKAGQPTVLQLAASSSDCVSSGAIEKRIAEAIR